LSVNMFLFCSSCQGSLATSDEDLHSGDTGRNYVV
jgi:hypothetical protein